jgi:hypothetical protein
MSENCPDDCTGNKKLRSLRAQLNAGKVVKKVVGAEMESVTYAAGYSLRNRLSHVDVYADDQKVRRLSPDEQSRVAEAYGRIEDAVQRQEARVENCPGECAARIEQGPLAGKAVRLCGLAAMKAVQD